MSLMPVSGETGNIRPLFLFIYLKQRAKHASIRISLL
jgi:hypothetical protein